MCYTMLPNTISAYNGERVSERGERFIKGKPKGYAAGRFSPNA